MNFFPRERGERNRREKEEKEERKNKIFSSFLLHEVSTHNIGMMKLEIMVNGRRKKGKNEREKKERRERKIERRERERREREKEKERRKWKKDEENTQLNQMYFFLLSFLLSFSSYFFLSLAFFFLPLLELNVKDKGREKIMKEITERKRNKREKEENSLPWIEVFSFTLFSGEKKTRIWCVHSLSLYLSSSLSLFSLSLFSLSLLFISLLSLFSLSLFSLSLLFISLPLSSLSHIFPPTNREREREFRTFSLSRWK